MGFRAADFLVYLGQGVLRLLELGLELLVFRGEFPVIKEVRASFVPLSHEVRASARASAGQVRLVNRTILNMPGIMNINGGKVKLFMRPAEQ